MLPCQLVLANRQTQPFGQLSKLSPPAGTRTTAPSLVDDPVADHDPAGHHSDAPEPLGRVR